MSHNRQWMYRRYAKGRFRNEFADGLEVFIYFASSKPAFMDGKKIKCPCNLKTCQNTSWLDPYAVRLHLAKYGFVPNYYTWKHHGETSVAVSNKTVVDEKTNLDGAEENFEANSKDTSDSQAVEEEEVDDDEHDFKTWQGFLRICDPKRDGSFLEDSYLSIANEVRARAAELCKPSPGSTKRRRVNWNSIYLDVAELKDLVDDVESGSDADTESSCGSSN